MFKIKDGVMKLTRGDTAQFKVSIYIQENENEEDLEEYEVLDTDIVTFTVKKSDKETDTNILLQKVNTGTALFKIKPSDTQNLSYGSYVYDVELTTADGDVYTVVEPSKFQITSEVTW